MAENVLYADLNLPEPTRPRILTVPDVQGSCCTYAEVKVKSQDTNAAANCKSSGGEGYEGPPPSSGSGRQQQREVNKGDEEAESESCCSRKHVAILVVIILLLLLAVYLIITYGPNANSQEDSTASIPEEALGCPLTWKKHGRKCYFFSSEENQKDWNASREECAALGSDLVIIDSREELRYLHSKSKYKYYLLGLTYSQEEQKWKWINNVEHDQAMFPISRNYSDYDCTVIGYGEVQTAPCGGSLTTQNMCEKAATISKRHQKES